MQSKETKVKSKGLSFKDLSARVFDSHEVSGLSPKSARLFLNGKLAKLVNGTARSISCSSTRTFGCAFMSFGLFSLILHLLEYYFEETPTVALSSLVISAIIALVSIPLLVVDRPMCNALQEFPISDYILFEFFSIKRMRTDRTVNTLKPYVGVIVGIFPALIGFFWSVEYVVLITLAIIFAVIAFISPEFPFLFTLLVLPYLPLVSYGSIVLVALSLLSLLSFWRKVLLGKRVYNFEAYDLGIILLLLIFAVGGAIYGGYSSTFNTGIMISLLLGYIPAGNLVLNRRLADCTVNSITVSSVPVAVVAIAQYISAIFGSRIAPVSSTFTSSDDLTVFLTVVSVIAIFYAHEEKEVLPKIFYSTALILNLVALIATENLFVVIVILLCALAYAILKAPAVPNELIVIAAALPYALFLLPLETLMKICAFLGIPEGFTEIISDFSKTLSLFIDNALLGVGARGFGEDVGYPAFNMLLGIGCRFGVFALLLFALVMLLRLRHLSAFARYYKTSSARVPVIMSAVAIFAFFVMGSLYDVFESTSLLYLFWCIMGFCSANLRIAKKEHNDRVDYYRDQRSFDSADTSILLHRK